LILIADYLCLLCVVASPFRVKIPICTIYLLLKYCPRV